MVSAPALKQPPLQTKPKQQRPIVAMGAHTLAGLESISLVSSQSAPKSLHELPREYTLDAAES
jgi:hypothetical protein